MLAVGPPGILDGRDPTRVERRIEQPNAATRSFPRRPSTNTASPDPPLPLADLFSVDRIKIPLDSLDKRGILAELSELLASGESAPDSKTRILEAIGERETVLSTGIGNGIALPHAKCGALESLTAAAGLTRDPVEFEAVDGRPVRLVVMLVGPPSSAGLHVRTLGWICRRLRDARMRSQLLAAETPAEFCRLLIGAETE